MEAAGELLKNPLGLCGDKSQLEGKINFIMGQEK